MLAASFKTRPGKVADPALAASVCVPPLKFDPPIAAAFRLTVPAKFSARALFPSRASTVTPKAVPACKFEMTVVTAR